MKKMTVTDPVPGCVLDTVEVEVTSVSLTIKDDEGNEETFAFRCFFPQAPDGEPLFMQDIVNHLLALLAQTEGEEQGFYRWIFVMLQFYTLSSEIDPRRNRAFKLKTVDYSKTFKEIAEMTGTRSLPPSERLVKFAGKISVPTTRLIREAIYRQPGIRVPLFYEEYVRFGERSLLEMLEVRSGLEKMLREELENVRRRIARDSQMPPVDRDKALARLKAAEDGEGNDFVWKTVNVAERLVIESAVEEEDRLSPQFADLAEEARSLQEPIVREVTEKKMEMVAEDGQTWTREYEDCIRANFDPQAADVLFDKAIKRYVDAYRMPVVESAYVTEEPPSGAEDASVVTPVSEDVPWGSPRGTTHGQTAESGSVEWQQYTGLLFARHTDEIFYKWYMVGWIATNLVNFAGCFRLLHREAERVWFGVLDYGFRQLYRKIHHLMTAAERRVFVLMYFALPAFDYRIAAFDGVLMSFFYGMDEETQAMIIMRLAFKVDQWNEIKEIGKKLGLRWRSYLRFYPSWVEIMQDEDAEKERKGVARRRELSLQGPIGSDEEEPATLEDFLPDEKSNPENLFQALALGEYGTVEGWAAKYCAPKQTQRILRYFKDGRTVVEIAEEEGINHQAVSKSIREGRKRIEEGLRKDGTFDRLEN